MNKKLFLLALCSIMVLAPMLFGSAKDDVYIPISTTKTISICPNYEKEISPIPASPTSRQEDTLHYDNKTTATCIGYNSAGLQWAGAIRLTTDELAAYTGYNIIAVVIKRCDHATINDTLIIYGQGTPTAPGPVVTSQTWVPVLNSWNRIDLTTPVPIDGVNDIWISDLHTESPAGYPLGAGPGPYVAGKGDWVWDATNGWYELGPGLDYNWNIWAIVEPGGTINHDVGVTSIVSPATMVMVSSTHTPEVIVRNFGQNNETFDVQFKIDSLLTNIYSSTQNVTVNAGQTQNVQFSPDWNVGPNPFTYDVVSYTELAGDENPANDTASQQTQASQVYWEILTDLPSASSGHEEATIDDSTYMIFGWHPSGSYLPSTYIYDIATDTWTAGPDNPYGDGSYGIAYGANGKYYRIGGTNWTTAYNRVDIYDPSTGTWSAGATCPITNSDMIGGVYNDSLVYMFGGGNWGPTTPHTNVYFYDTYLDNWTQATSFPGVGRGCLAGGVIDTFAIVAAGYDGSTTYRSDYIVGIIDPSDCSVIAWGTSTTIPGFTGRYRVASGVDRSNNPEFWVTCGGNLGGQLAEIWSYDPYIDTWTDQNMPKNRAIGNVTPVPATTTDAGDIGVFVAGGYAGPGSYETDHEVFHSGKTTGVGVEETPGMTAPFVFGLTQNAPNPIWSGYTAISYTITKKGSVSLKLYDVVGRLVRTLVNRENEAAGTKTVYWNGMNDNNNSVSAGVYFYRLTAEGRTATKKMVVVK